ncbi:MAG TPA: hypothetical protein VHS28_01555 [Chloroflexota bacterium]|nr:hypothetical protein [Chloroflexota bacterium]
MAKGVTTGLTIANVPFGDTVKAGDLVGWSNGKLVRACGVSSGPIPTIGVAAASYQSDELGAVHLAGEVSGFTDLVAGDTQYLSLSTPGDIQSIPPSGAGSLMQVVGYAVASDRLIVAIRDGGSYL